MKRQRLPKANRTRRILIADPFELARIGLSSIILAASRFAVCAATGDFDEAFELVQRHRPELVVADPFVNCRDGIFWMKDFVGRFPETKLFIATWNPEEHFAERALRAGARGYWMKGGSAESLMQAIESVLDGGIYVNPLAALLAVQKLVEPKRNGERSLGNLSDRELHVFTLIAAGHGVGQIARELGISRKTVETHCDHIKGKLGYEDAKALKRGARASLGQPDYSPRSLICRSGTSTAKNQG
jgi:DNA-binding NarL/FixJ family response regulator